MISNIILDQLIYDETTFKKLLYKPEVDLCQGCFAIYLTKVYLSFSPLVLMTLLFLKFCLCYLEESSNTFTSVKLFYRKLKNS